MLHLDATFIVVVHFIALQLFVNNYVLFLIIRLRIDFDWRYVIFLEDISTIMVNLICALSQWTRSNYTLTGQSSINTQRRLSKSFRRKGCSSCKLISNTTCTLPSYNATSILIFKCKQCISILHQTRTQEVTKSEDCRENPIIACTMGHETI